MPEVQNQTVTPAAPAVEAVKAEAPAAPEAEKEMTNFEKVRGNFEKETEILMILVKWKQRF
jgi:hypothetical protein